MSKYVGSLSGSAPVMKKYHVGITIPDIGVPLIGPTGDNEGLLLGGTTTSADAMGMNLDTGTYNTAQQSDGSDPSQSVTVIVNPDAIWEARLCGSATVEGTALTAYYNTVASATGVLATLSATSGGATVDMTTMDDKVVFCYSGANAGQYRRAEPADATDINFTQAFRYAIAVNDLFILCPLTPGAIQTVTWTDEYYEIDAVVGTSANTTPTWRAIDLKLNDIGNNGLLNSYVDLICMDHAFCGSALA